ncbi:IGHMBP2 family helicase [Palaeococcus sp. (in: euryarchaeotes)]
MRVFESYREYVSHFSRLVQLEREEEMRQQTEEIEKLSGQKREKLGRAVLNLTGKDIGRGLGGKYLVKFGRKNFPETEISVGDLVIVSLGKPKPRDPQGTVVEKGRNFLVVAFDKKPPSFVYRKKVRIDLYANDITFQRMLDALKLFGKGDSRLGDVILGKRKPSFIPSQSKIHFVNDSLNPSQKIAVKKSLEAQELFLIHGPPGTGKTTTLVESIVQHVKRGYKVLATADSNIAVDNLVEKLVNAGIVVVRVGNPARVSKPLLEHTLDYLIQKDESFKESEEIWRKIDVLREEQRKYTKPSPQWRRGLSDEQIKSLARSGRSSRGVPSRRIQEMAKWLELQDRINSLVKRARVLELKAVNSILERAQVVCSTNSTAGSELLMGRKFDVVFIDEATQSVEPSCIIPIVRGKKLIMAGDHKQLPPTILSQKAKVLEFTLFERLLEVYGDDIKSILRVQYRMNERIMEFPNKEFYGGLLMAHPSVAKHSLEDFPLTLSVLEESEGWLKKVLIPPVPLVFIDTLGLCEERQRRGSTSRENPCEAEIVAKITKKLLEMGVKASDIGVISPYDDQIDLLRRMINVEGLEIKTVDGYQGREKEVIVISFVRSNNRGELGFLEDLRRLNVAITRAKRKLIMIGDSKTLSSNETYKRLIEYVRGEGGYILWEP